MKADLDRVFPVLLSGGSGVRLWPLSRKSTPKQLIRLIEARTLFQQAALRASDSKIFAPITVITGAEHRFAIAEQLRAVGAVNPTIVLEPVARNTAAAAAVAAVLAARVAPDGLVLLMPADHLITDEGAFHAALARAVPSARRGQITLFGIRPDAPITGYGYIRAGTATSSGEHARRVAAFVEKPDRTQAEAYLESGDYLWNSGIVLTQAGVLLEEIASREPELLEAARAAVDDAAVDADFIRLAEVAFARCRSVSLDYAVLERSERVAVVPTDCGWRDIGSWSALWEAAEHDESGNAIVGNVIAEATTDSYIRSEGPLVATLGVSGLIVVVTDDAVLVASKDRDQDVREIVERVRERDEDRL